MGHGRHVPFAIEIVLARLLQSRCVSQIQLELFQPCLFLAGQLSALGLRKKVFPLVFELYHQLPDGFNIRGLGVTVSIPLWLKLSSKPRMRRYKRGHERVHVLGRILKN